MVQINFAQKSVNVKIVYYGPGMSGKTTNLEVIHQRAPEGNRGDLTSISTDGDRTLFFDFMPLDLGTVAGMRTQFQIYTVPGQVYYNSTRKLVLQGVDGVVFVADSSASMLQENLDSLRNLEENLLEYGKNIETIPWVIQYNKRDLPDAMSIEDLQRTLNPRGVPIYEGIANTGQGVFPTLKSLAALVLDAVHASNGMAGSSHSSRPAAQRHGVVPPIPSAPAPHPAPSMSPGSPPVQTAGTGFYSQAAVPAPPSMPHSVPQHAPAAAHMPPAAPRPEPPPLTPAQAPYMGQPAGMPHAGYDPAAYAPQPYPGMAHQAAQQYAPAPPAPHMQPGVSMHPGMHDMGAQVPMTHAPGPPMAPQHHQRAPQHGSPGLRLAAQGPSAAAPMQMDGGAAPAPSPNYMRKGGARAPRASGPVPKPAPTRLTPRSSHGGSKKAGNRIAMLTGLFVALALAAGVLMGSLVFNIF